MYKHLSRFPRSKSKQDEIISHIDALYPGLDSNYTNLDKWWIYHMGVEPDRCVCGNVVHVSADGNDFNKFCSTECAKANNIGKTGQGTPLPCSIDEFIEQCKAADYKVQPIAKRYNVSYPVAVRWFNECNIQELVDQRNREWLNVINSNLQLNVPQLARLLNTTTTKVKLFCVKNGIELIDVATEKRRHKRRVLDEHQHLFKDHTLTEIAEITGVHYESVKSYRREHDFPIVVKSMQHSKKELELLSFVQSYCPNAGSRKYTIASKVWECDVMIPELNLGFEFNGCYYHNSFKIDTSYHKRKTDAFDSVGVQLIHIWEHDWATKRPIIKSLIESRLGVSKRIYARQCVIAEVPGAHANQFFEETHLKGAGKNGITSGLYYDGELVMCMRFARHPKHEWELLRMSSKLGVTVVGGMSKILAHFKRQHQPTQLMSYVDRDISNGKSYYACGFTLISKTPPSYWYVDNKFNVHQRQKYQRHKIGQNEAEYTRQIGLYRIHNSGNLKMLLTF